MLMLSFLSLHAAGAVAAHELGDVGDGDAVEIAGDAVLQAARRDCELERRLLVLIVVQPVDQAAKLSPPPTRSMMSRISYFLDT